jgi:hypothetical protein
MPKCIFIGLLSLYFLGEEIAADPVEKIRESAAFSDHCQTSFELGPKRIHKKKKKKSDVYDLFHFK